MIAKLHLKSYQTERPRFGLLCGMSILHLLTMQHFLAITAMAFSLANDIVAVGPARAKASSRVDSKEDAWPLHPDWVPTYAMARSTKMMPCNTSGWFDANLAAKYGIVDFDWSTGRAMWANHKPM